MATADSFSPATAFETLWLADNLAKAIELELETELPTPYPLLQAAT